MLSSNKGGSHNRQTPYEFKKQNDKAVGIDCRRTRYLKDRLSGRLASAIGRYSDFSGCTYPNSSNNRLTRRWRSSVGFPRPLSQRR